MNPIKKASHLKLHRQIIAFCVRTAWKQSTNTLNIRGRRKQVGKNVLVCSEVSGLKFCPNTVYPCAGLTWSSFFAPGKSQNCNHIYIKAASFHILSDSLFTNLPTILQYLVYYGTHRI